jgi:peptidyl-prolyl cis-trans isomerase SurA
MWKGMRKSLRKTCFVAGWLTAGLAVAEIVATQPIEQVLVKVNGDIITKLDLEERQRAVLAQRHGRPISAVEVHADPNLASQAAALAPHVVLDAIDELLLMQRADDLGLGATDDDVESVIARMRADNNISTDLEFEALLRKEGIPVVALRKSVHRQIRVEQVRQQLFRRLSVSDDEMKAFYDTHRDEFASGPTATFRELVVNLPSIDDTRTSSDASRAYDAGLIRFVKAQDRIRAGESFETVARDVSDAPSRTESGAVGPIDPADLAEPVRAALDRLRPGQLSAPVRTASAYVLLKLEARTPARRNSFDAVRSAVQDRMLAARRDAALNQLLVALRASALIVWKDSALKAACLAVRDPAGG